MLRITFAAALAGIGLFLLTAELTRRGRLTEKYSILWFATAIGVLLVAVIPGALDGIARFLGIAYPPTALLLIAFAFSLALILHLSIVVSRLSRQTTTLNQTLAALQAELGEEEAREMKSASEASVDASAT